MGLFIWLLGLEQGSVARNGWSRVESGVEWKSTVIKS